MPAKILLINRFTYLESPLRLSLKLATIGASFLSLLSMSVSVSGSDWFSHQDMLETRVIAGSKHLASDGKLMLAWEAKLAPGWKTYWRSPGEAGLPVRVFSKGTEQTIFYPLPARFELFGLQTYGYGKYVMMPFEIDAPAEGSDVAVEVDFMVCKEICVPFRTAYKVPASDIAQESSINDGGIKRWLGKVPAKTGDDGAGLDILSAKVVGPVGHQKVIVDVKASHSLSNADLLAEVNDMFHFGKPEMRLLGDGKSARFVLPAMAGSKPTSLKGLYIRLTLADGKNASIERTLKLPK